MIIFFGKGGSNARNLLERDFPVQAGFTNEPNSEAIAAFEKRNIPVEVIKSTDEILQRLQSYDPRLIVLAGFMRIMPAEVTARYRMINIHPSLLPHYKGLHAQKRSFEDKKHCGITIHYVNEKLDDGEIIAQVPLDADCDFTEYMRRLKAAEHEHLPKVVAQLLQ